MELNDFKDGLVNLLNEYGEEEVKLADMDVHDRENIIEVEVADGSRFKITVSKWNE